MKATEGTAPHQNFGMIVSVGLGVLFGGLGIRTAMLPRTGYEGMEEAFIAVIVGVPLLLMLLIVTVQLLRLKCGWRMLGLLWLPVALGLSILPMYRIKPHIATAFLLGTLFCIPCKADKINPFVRIACIPENGLLDIDARSLHDSVSTKPGAAQDGAKNALSRGGFHQPSQLKFTCELGDIKYVIEAEQAPKSNAICGASPDINLKVMRNGIPLFSDVTFGRSCAGRPSVMRITIGDGRNSWRGRETEVCYGISDSPALRHCEWTAGSESVFAKRFPIADADVERIVAPLKKK